MLTSFLVSATWDLLYKVTHSTVFKEVTCRDMYINDRYLSAKKKEKKCAVFSI